MPSIREKTTKTGNKFYEIRVSRGRGKSYLTTRWYPPEGWSKRAIDWELARQAAEFERQTQATCVKVYTILQGIFKMAYLADLIDRNPMDKVERPKPRKDELKSPPKRKATRQVN